MSGAFWRTVGRGFRRAALPLVSYYAVTLAVPVANGAAQSGAAFMTHAIPCSWFLRSRSCLRAAFTRPCDDSLSLSRASALRSR